VLKDDPAAEDVEDNRLAACMRICQVALYVDVALVGNTIEQVWPHLYGLQHTRHQAAQRLQLLFIATAEQLPLQSLFQSFLCDFALARSAS
jgi:hypothetical protein